MRDGNAPFAAGSAVPWAMHASAVAIGGKALLIRGPSRSGKSRLACALIAHGAPQRPIALIGDDRILLQALATGLVARPHPRIAGFIERRGLGIVAMPWTARATVGGIVHIGRDEPPRGEEDGALALLPHLEIIEPEAAESRAAIVLAWWASRSAACAPHLVAKADAGFRQCTKD